VKHWLFFDESENIRAGRDSDTDDNLPFRLFWREEEVNQQPADGEQEAIVEEKVNNQREDERSSTATDKMLNGWRRRKW